MTLQTKGLHKARPDKIAIKQAIKRVLKRQDEIAFAYLHGSFVEGAFFRDIDIAIYLAKMPPSILEYELQIETQLMMAVKGYIFDVRVLNTAPLSFKYNVIKDGIILLQRDESKRIEFQERTISAYLDFLPYRKRYLEENLGIKI